MSKFNFNEEFPAEKTEDGATPDANAVVDTSVPTDDASAKTETDAADATDATDATANTTYTMNDGTQGSRAAYIREKFVSDNMSRKDIAEKFEFAYRVVYSATVNLTNDAESTTRGRATQNAVIQVTDANELVVTVPGVDGAAAITYVQGKAIEGDAPATHDKARNEWIQEQVDAGANRGDIAKLLDLSYGVIYNITKEQDGTRVKHDVTLEDGKVVSRAEYIRIKFAAGETRGDIAKELDVPYSIVWQATKTEKSDADKFAEVVAELTAFTDVVTDKAMFETILTSLKGVVIVEAPATDETAPAATDAAPVVDEAAPVVTE